MKKLFNIFLAVCLSCLLWACSDSKRQQLASAAEQINYELPIPLGNGINLDSVTYNDDANMLYIHYSLEEEFNSVSSLRGAYDSQRRFLRSFLSGQEGNEFAQAVVAADAGICLEYIGLKSNDKVEITFYNDEIKDLVANQTEAADERSQLANLVAVSNDQCPVQIDEGLVMTQVALGDQNLEFYYSYDADELDLNTIDPDQFKTIMWESLKEELSAPANQLQLNLMKKINVGVSYIFTASDSIAPVEFSFPASQIQKI